LQVICCGSFKLSLLLNRGGNWPKRDPPRFTHQRKNAQVMHARSQMVSSEFPSLVPKDRTWTERNAFGLDLGDGLPPFQDFNSRMVDLRFPHDFRL